MSETHRPASTQNTQFVKAPPETVYHAFTDPAALAIWFAPGDMTARVHHFDLRIGGGYQMSLYYPLEEGRSEEPARGKTSDREDRYTARFIELIPPERIVEAITFDSDNPAFSGEMTMTVTLQVVDGGTMVSILFKDIPAGIRPEDNETGTRLSLEKLARFLEPGA